MGVLELKIVDSNYFQILFYFYFSFSFIFILELKSKGKNDVTVTVTGSYDMKKNIEESRINNIIQHNNSMLIL